jgi:tetratricopeptide (TPR) repeat protein
MFDQARRDFEAIGNSSGAAINEQNVALMHALLGHPVPPRSADADPVSALEIDILQEHFSQARAKAEALLKTADKSDRETRRAATLMLGLALARSGAAAPGLAECLKAVDLASGNPSAEADALLASAEAARAAGDRTSAIACAKRAQAYFESAKHPESLWRASVLLGQSDRATAALDRLKSSWPPEDFNSYLNRPPVKRLYTELTETKNK